MVDSRAKSKSATRRTASCRYCGGEHRRKSKEARQCRESYRNGKAPIDPDPATKEPNERKPGSPTTHYEAKPESWALAAKKLQRQGWPIRKIAKNIGVNVGDVRKVLGVGEGR